MNASSGKPNRRISDIALSCIELFNGCLSKDRVFFAILEGEGRRFWAWSNSLKVFGTPHVNLDTQLLPEKHAQIREMVLLLLDVLRDNLSLAFNSDNSQQITDTSRSPLEIPLYGVDGSLRRLEKIAVAIFHATQASLTRRVIVYAKKQPDYKEITRVFSLAILSRYRGLGPEDMPMFGIPEKLIPSPDEVLTTQPLGLFLALVKSSVVRHYRIAYERHENERENKKTIPQVLVEEEPEPPADGLDRVKQQSNRPETIPQEGLQLPELLQPKPREETESDTTPTPLSIQPDVFREKLGEDASSSGSRIPVSEAGVATYPQAPKISEGQEHATCPICKKSLPANVFTQRDRWRSHVNEDIKPYVCISEDCMPNLQFFEDSFSWINHMHKTHTTQWVRYLHNAFIWSCPVCGDISPTEFASKQEMEQNLLRHFAESHSGVVEESRRRDIASVSGIPQHCPMYICPICGEHHHEKTPPELPSTPDRESTYLKEGEDPTARESTKALGSKKKQRFDVPMESNGDEEVRTTQGSMPPTADRASKRSRPIGVEKCISEHLKGLAVYFLNHLIEVETDDEDDTNSNESADTLLLGVLSLPSVGSKADPPQFQPAEYDGPPITNKEKEEVKICMERNSKELLESCDWDHSRRIPDPELSPDKLEDFFPDTNREGNERVWEGTDPRYVLAYVACILVVLELCKKALVDIEQRDNNTRHHIMQLQEYLTSFSTALNRFPWRDPNIKTRASGYVPAIEKCASDSLVISARLTSGLQLAAGLQRSSEFDDTALRKKVQEDLIKIGKTVEFRIVLADINGNIGDIQILDEQEIPSLLTSNQWNLIREIVLAIKGRTSTVFQTVKEAVETFIDSSRESLDTAETKPFNIDAEIAFLLNGMSDGDLRSFAELHEDPVSDEQIELYIYTCFLIFTRTRSAESLEQAIQRTEGWIAVTASEHPDRDRRFHIFGMILAEMSQEENDWRDGMYDLTTLGRRIWGEIRNVGHLDRGVEVAGKNLLPAPRFSSLGVGYGKKFEDSGSMVDLQYAVEYNEFALAVVPINHHVRPALLNNLGWVLGKRFELTGKPVDLSRAVELSGKAIEVTPLGHPDRGIWLSNFGYWLGTQFMQTGEMEALNRAIQLSEEAVTAASHDDSDLAGCLFSLGIWLYRRFGRIGIMSDLQRAVEVSEEAMLATSLNDPFRAGRLGNLANCLEARFEQTGDLGDLELAIKISNEAVGVLHFDHPDRPGCLMLLGNLLSRRSELTGEIGDLDHAVEAAEKALAGLPSNSPNRAGWLSNLGAKLGDRFKKTGVMADLDRAVKVSDEGVAAMPFGHRDRARALNILGNRLRERSYATGSSEDLRQSLLRYKEGWNSPNTEPSRRIKLARTAASILASQSKWEESSAFLGDAIKLLPLVSPQSLKHTDKQYLLAEFAGLASMAAATTLNAGKEAYHALQLLELGRGVIAGLLMEVRRDISDLGQQHPDLAKSFTSLRDELDAPADRTISLIPSPNTSSWESQASRRLEADQEFDKLLIKIRAQPGFENILLPPTVDELMAAANPGPIIVVNLSSYCCVAFLVERCQIRALELPQLSLEEVEKRAKNLRSDLTTTLAWLWRVVAYPCLEALGFTQPPSEDNWPHIWWIPTGALSHFPLHAAGRHFDSSKETVLDRVMSSYSSSVKALIYGRRQRVRMPAPSELEDALLVGMQNTPDQPPLPFAAREVAMLEDLCPSLRLKPVRLPRQRREDVLAHFRTCKIFHFAGHGESDPSEPSRSRLLLEDWKTTPLTVSDLRDHCLHENSPFLAYLSACSTGANKVERLTDETIHLISACQLAGFRHVVGTLWEVDDWYSVYAARVVYEAVRDKEWKDEAVALGVHKAARLLRAKTGGGGQGDIPVDVDERREVAAIIDREGGGSGRNRGVYDDAIPEEGIPSIWAAYIHVGP